MNEIIKKVEVANQPVYIIDTNTKEGRLMHEVILKLKNKEEIGISVK